MPTLSRQLTKTKKHFASEVELIIQFVDSAAELISLEKAKPLLGGLKTRDLKEFDLFVEQARAGKISMPPPSIETGTVIAQILNLMRQKYLLAEMVLTHLITFQEAFLKDYLKSFCSIASNSLDHGAK